MKALPEHHPICSLLNPGPTRCRPKVLVTVAAAALCLLPFGEACAQSDNFDDGDAAGWTPYDPIAGAVPPGIATFTVTNRAYRIRTAPSPLPLPPPNGVGPGRAGSLRGDVTYTDFYITVDVVNWDPALDQAFGAMARVDHVGLGQTTGYAMTWSSDSQDLDISRITGEVPTGVSVAGNDKATFVPGRSYRLLFIGKGAVLTGRVYELPNLTTPLADISGADLTYSSGISGLVVYDNTSGGTGTTDVTFDNYLALPEEPPRLSFFIYSETQEIQVTWPITYTGYVLESTPVLPATTWTEEDVISSGDVNFHLEDARFGNKYFRLRK